MLADELAEPGAVTRNPRARLVASEGKLRNWPTPEAIVPSIVPATSVPACVVRVPEPARSQFTEKDEVEP